MWHAARQQEKKIKVLMVDHKKRAERRKAYYESRLGDPSQLLRLTGTGIKLYPDAEQHFYYENPEKSLMTWEGDNETRIDRFDGRSLLDFLPVDFPNVNQQMPNDERDIQEELNFERFRELVENERRNVSEKECLEENEAEWTSLLERHKALMKKLQDHKPESSTKSGFCYDYGTEKRNASPSDEEETHEDILDYVENLTEKDRQTLNEMGRQYNIPDYTRLLRVAKRDRQEKANELKETEKIKERKSRRHSHGSRKGRRRDKRAFQNRSYSTRDSPTYEPYTDTDTSSSSSEDRSNKDNIDANEEDFIIRFGDSEESPLPESQNSIIIPNTSDVQISASSLSRTRKLGSVKPTSTGSGAGSVSVPSKAVPQKKLSPAEKLRLRTQMGLNKQSKIQTRLTQEEISLVSTQIVTRNLQSLSNIRSRDSLNRGRRKSNVSSSRSRSRSHSRTRRPRDSLNRGRRKSNVSSSQSRSRSRSRTRRPRDSLNRRSRKSNVSFSRSRSRSHSRTRRPRASLNRGRRKSNISSSRSRSRSHSRTRRSRRQRSLSNSRSPSYRRRSRSISRLIYFRHFKLSLNIVVHIAVVDVLEAFPGHDLHREADLIILLQVIRKKGTRDRVLQIIFVLERNGNFHLRALELDLQVDHVKERVDIQDRANSNIKSKRRSSESSRKRSESREHKRRR
ncbi:2080_t:CDS:10 [Ambispora leptoticha]|uniref:2080_t:CDS:1 n=1 Tax=Ambispora leptoticha TaxID=144679 RepID=A0A9N8YY93_9GLOM|nr:2080_t:CDS:10 [Ambispora leptoticha]